MTLDRALLLGGDDIKASRPHVEGAKVEAKILEQNKVKKVVAYKSKVKKNYRNKGGHR